ncbi:MAG TPA: prephenate dehydrogenase/arogenate dehydrogenase family protein [Gemmatimonadaceae bacterium]|nr:prephenate dehydrogenase/arogenate dehydrogenase family protein [Gemmatimonadaceae bacterium]
MTTAGAPDGFFKSATVVGLGLIGGSIARDLTARGVRVRGYDADREQLDAAVRDGIVSDPLDIDFDGAGADVIVLAVPVDQAPAMLRRLARVARSARLVTDVGSTKTSIVNEARALGLDGCFVGSHPMAGDHRSGWTASRRNLFADALVYLCPVSPPRTVSPVVEVAKHFWMWLGATPSLIDAEAHDRHVAWTSHLPHLVSMALGLALAGAGIDRDALGPGGRDTTRLAGSSPEMWTAIAADNRAAIDEALASAEREVATLRAALRGGDTELLRERFAASQAWFDRRSPASGG